jgi:hypothetical protein
MLEIIDKTVRNLSTPYKINNPSLTALLTACAEVTQSSL